MCWKRIDEGGKRYYRSYGGNRRAKTWTFGVYTMWAIYDTKRDIMLVHGSGRTRKEARANAHKKALELDE
jgi:uncharacterized protein with GYD domain